jgi:hypothetical protein
VLTRITGHFQGGGERVILSWDGTTWSLAGASLQQGVSGQATCFKKDLFLASGSSRWNSPTFAPTGVSGKKCVKPTSTTWWGDAGTFLTGLTGNFAGGGEAVSVNQSSGGFTPSVLTVQSCQPFVGGYAHAFFAGQPSSGKVAQFWGPNGKGPAAVAGEYTVFASSLNQSKVTAVQMAPVDEAMCYFTKLGGKFRGGGEFAEITPDFNSQGIKVWVLRVQSLQSDGMTGSARCFRRNQQ